MAEEEILTTEDSEDVYNILDVVNTVKGAGVTAANQKTLRYFLISNDDAFGDDAYLDFIEATNEICDLYIAPLAAHMYYKTPADLTEEERVRVWKSLTVAERDSILLDMLEIAQDYDIILSMAIDANNLPVWSYNLRDSGEAVNVNYVTEYGSAPEPTAYTGALTEENLPTLTADGYAHTGWADYLGGTVSVGDDPGYAPTLFAVWAEETKTTLDPTSMLLGWLVGRQIAGMRCKKG